MNLTEHSMSDIMQLDNMSDDELLAVHAKAVILLKQRNLLDTMKECSKCHVFKTPSEYNRSKGNKNGLYSVCKACRKHESVMRYAVLKARKDQKRSLDALESSADA